MSLKLRKFLPPFLLVLGLIVVYLGTMAPGLTWANDGVDGGDLITAAATGGVAHPSGYPTYLLLASLFQALPVGTLAFRTNLLSACMAALAALVLYFTVTQLPDSPARGNRLAGLIAALLFGLSPLLWSQAVISEVYTLHALFCALLLWYALQPAGQGRNRWLDLGAGALSGLALGNHLTSIFLLPAIFICRAFNLHKKWSWPSAGRFLAGLGAGLLVYLVLPLRALGNPPVNWGNPQSWQQFTWLVSGQLYQGRLTDFSLAVIAARLPDLLEILLRQFELPGLLLALVGLIYVFKPGRLHFVTLWNFAAFVLFALLYASFDSYMYLIPALLSLAVWAGVGLNALMNPALKPIRVVKPVIIVVICVFLAGMLVARWPQVDARPDQRAEAFAAQIVQEVPAHALVFAAEDWDVFTLWYLHFALGQRPDMVVMATDLLHFDWYDQTLRSTYPQVNWPDDLFWPQTVTAANPTRPVCTVSWMQAVRVNCSPAP